MGYQGNMRTLLLPEEFNNFPTHITGLGRITKIYPGKRPYTSIVELKNHASGEVINTILSDSYQVRAEILLSEFGDQSVMLSKLPEVKGNTSEEKSLSLQEYVQQKSPLLTKFFQRSLDDIEQIVQYFENDDFAYLMSREIKFQCHCSRERMKKNLLTLDSNTLKNILKEEGSVNATCDYCHTVYRFTQEDLSL